MWLLILNIIRLLLDLMDSQVNSIKKFLEIIRGDLKEMLDKFHRGQLDVRD
jgi:hypothetical protein